MSYKDRFYQQYVSAHTKQVYGPVSREDLIGSFVFNDAYFGSLMPKEKDAAILDIGCGNGSFVLWLQERGFKNAGGVDISKEQIEQGAAFGIKNISIADFNKFLEAHPGEYDLIFARDVLEHQDKESILDLLALIKGALRPGGVFISQTVNAENPLWGRLRHADFTHDLAFTQLSMRQLLIVSGFEDISIYPQRPVVHGVFSLLRRILWWCIEVKLHLYLLIETGSLKGIFTQNIISVAHRTP